MSVYSVFHVSLLEPVSAAHNNQYQDLPPTIEVLGQEEFIVERILDSRVNDSDQGLDYLVHWKDFSPAHDSWEPWEEVVQTQVYRQYYKKNKNKPGYHFPSPAAHRKEWH